MCLYVCMHIYIYTYIICVYIYIYIYRGLLVPWQGAPPTPPRQHNTTAIQQHNYDSCVCIYIYTHIQMYMCVYIYIYI